MTEQERWQLIRRGRLRLLTPDERDQLLRWLPPSDARVFTFTAGIVEVAEVERILGRPASDLRKLGV